MKRVHRLVAVMSALVLSFSCAYTSTSGPTSKLISNQSPTLAIHNVTVIDAIQGVRNSQTVVLRGDEIVSVGESDRVPVADRVIDGTGKFLIPGLWDMHVHLTYDDRFTPTMPSTFLRWGITSVRDTGGMLNELLPVVRAMRAPDAVAPRVFFSGPLLDGEHVVYDGDSRPLIGTTNPSVEAARANVRRLHANGVDFIKIYELVSPQVFAALVDEARLLSMPIASHVPLSLLASQAGPEVDSMEHLRNVELDCAADAQARLVTRRERLARENPESGYALRSSLHSLQRLNAIERLDESRCSMVLDQLENTIQVPTLRLNALMLSSPFEQDDWEEALSGTDESVQQAWGTPPEGFTSDVSQRDTRFATYSLGMVQRMFEAGVPIGAGTDTPIGFALPGYSLHRELEMLVRAGLSPMDALHAATIRPAEFVRKRDAMGAVQAGMRADLLLLQKNPLLDIRNTRAIDTVISKGRVVVH